MNEATKVFMRGVKGLLEDAEERRIPGAKFLECTTCNGKPGMPALCMSCLHNREVIGSLVDPVDLRSLFDNWKDGYAELALMEMQE